MAKSLHLTKISKAFGDTGVLSAIDLTVEPGEFLSLVGPSGCGKSTLLRIIAGLERQDAGHVAIDGMRVDALSPRARNIAMVFQNYALYPHMTAAENIALPLTVDRLSLVERLPLIGWLSPRRARVLGGITTETRQVAQALQIEALLGRKPGQLSGGQRQRVALARAMVRQPSLFLMDEPLSNLDAQLRVHMRDELTELHRRLGATFIYVTHDQIEAMTMSTRVAMLDRGQLAQIGTPTALYETPATLAVARFIGSPAINILPAKVDGTGQVMLGGQPIGMTLPGRAGDAVSIGLRPEHLHLVPLAQRHGLRGTVRRNEHHGADRLIHLDWADDRAISLVVRVAQTDAAGFQPGTTFGISASPADMHVFDGHGRRLAEVIKAGHRVEAAE